MAIIVSQVKTTLEESSNQVESGKQPEKQRSLKPEKLKKPIW